MMNKVFAATVLGAIWLTTTAFAGQATDSAVDRAVQLLAAARANHDQNSFAEAEKAFRDALARDSDNARALVHLGEVKVTRAGQMAAAGQFAAATQMIEDGMADMNRAVMLAPSQLDVRLTRGLTYAPFPSFYNLAPMAREDLGVVSRDPGFVGLSEAQRQRVAEMLGRVASAGTGVASSRADRFPNIPEDTSPVIAAASVTFAQGPVTTPPGWLTYVKSALNGSPGLLGVHTVASLDHPGMVIIFTWWKNKQALNDFYYSDAHQGWMSRRGQAIIGARAVSADDVPSQVAIEVFTAAPGGMRLNGGFAPAEIGR